MKPGHIAINMDARQAAAMLGGIEGMAAAMKTDRYTRSVVEYTHARMREQFDMAVDAAAQTANGRSHLHHVYEWRMIGLPAGRLWKHKLVGRGAHREATFAFTASKTKILTPKERRENETGISGNDPITEVPQENIDRLQNRAYFFYWKAPVMEYNMPVFIAPVNARRLFVPVRGAKKGFILSQGHYVSNPGGQNTGAFTQFWVTWWNTQAPNVWNNEVSKVIEQDLGRIPLERNSQKYMPKRSKVISLTSGPSNYRRAYLDGKGKAIDYIERTSTIYDETGGAEQVWNYGEEEW